MSSNERVAPERLLAYWPDRDEAHARARIFSDANNLGDRLGIIGPRLPGAQQRSLMTILEDSLAIKVSSERIAALNSQIDSIKSGRSSKRRVFGAYSRYRIKKLEKRKIKLFDAADYLFHEIKEDRDRDFKTERELKSMGVIVEAVDDLVKRAKEKGIEIRSGAKLSEDDIVPWEEEHFDRLYAVT